MVAVRDFVDKRDRIHVSLDVDGIDPSEFQCINTPVADGLRVEDLKAALKIVQSSDKLLSMDVVEFSPTTNPEHASDNIDTVMELVASVLT